MLESRLVGRRKGLILFIYAMSATCAGAFEVELNEDNVNFISVRTNVKKATDAVVQKLELGRADLADGTTAAANSVFSIYTSSSALRTTLAATVPVPESTPPANGNMTILHTPTNIADGTTVNLRCGTIYRGTLNLEGRKNIKVITEGACGKARLTPGSLVSGWTHYMGQIYTAPIGYMPAQVTVDGLPVEMAHWPNKPQIWASPGTPVPAADVVGASLVKHQNSYTIHSETIKSKRVTSSVPFYLEGKLWMLDSPGEWAVYDGKIYLWMPDSGLPEGRVWGSPSNVGINANRSEGIIIDNVIVSGASNGITGSYAVNLHIFNSEVLNSSSNGIYVHDTSGLVIEGNTIRNSVSDGISGEASNIAAVIHNNAVLETGTVGMPHPTHAAIRFGNSSINSRVSNNRVHNSSYIGISVSVGSVVSYNLIDGVCIVLGDCGAIYTNGSSAGYQPLNIRIENNTIRNVVKSGSKGIYLDDGASHVIVNGNNIFNTPSGLFIHNGSNNEITGNTFSSSKESHLGLALTSVNNVITGNTFNSTNGELTFHLEGVDLPSFGTFDFNIYKTTNVNSFAGLKGAKSFSYWKKLMRQDAHSKLN